MVISIKYHSPKGSMRPRPSCSPIFTKKEKEMKFFVILMFIPSVSFGKTLTCRFVETTTILIDNTKYVRSSVSKEGNNSFIIEFSKSNATIYNNLGTSKLRRSHKLYGFGTMRHIGWIFVEEIGTKKIYWNISNINKNMISIQEIDNFGGMIFITYGFCWFKENGHE